MSDPAGHGAATSEPDALAARRGAPVRTSAEGDAGSNAEAFSHRALLAYFLRLGTFGFGGPIVLSEHMERDLVEERRWITPQQFKEGFALAQVAPGPLAAQLAIYLGWVRTGVVGAITVGLAFIGPSFVMVLVLAMLYLRFGGLAWIQGAFYGISAAVIAIIARSALTLARKTVGRDVLRASLFAVSLIVTAWTESEVIWVVAASGVLTVLLKARPRLPRGSASAALTLVPTWLVSGLHGPAPLGLLWKVLWYFTEAGLFVFGSGLAIVPFLHGGVVQQYHWLSERQFLDAVAVSMITPGPVVITVAFIGYLAAGPLGAVLAAIGVFAPVLLVVVLVAPYYHRLAQNRPVKAFVDGVTAAATGAIAGAAFVLGRRAVVDLPTALLFAATLMLLLVAKRLPEPILLLAAGVAGVAIKTAASP